MEVTPGSHKASYAVQMLFLHMQGLLPGIVASREQAGY